MIPLLLAILISLPPTLAAPPAAEGTVSGVLSSYGRSCVSGCLALPGHRWGKPGLHVRICGPAACIIRTSTDAGPERYLQRPPHNRIADLSLRDWNLVAGQDTANGGLVRGTVTYIPAAPATNTQP